MHDAPCQRAEAARRAATGSGAVFRKLAHQHPLRRRYRNVDAPCVRRRWTVATALVRQAITQRGSLVFRPKRPPLPAYQWKSATLSWARPRSALRRRTYLMRPRETRVHSGSQVRRHSHGIFVMLRLSGRSRCGADGRLYAWGANDYGQLGVEDSLPRGAPSMLSYLYQQKVVSSRAEAPVQQVWIQNSHHRRWSLLQRPSFIHHTHCC
jgi:hypothetical protein